MASLKMFAVTILVIWITCCLAAPGSDGKYVHKSYPYVHVHDNRELGQYHHIHIPYDGGFGPYNGSNIPYLHDDHPYRHEEHTTPSTTTTSTTTTTTTSRPRIRYDDEGKWRIIRQEEEKKHHKYDYLYLTENGIYAEEQANLRDEQDRATGTSSKGFYEYTGDDGKLYRVHYTVGEQGFVPQADHIPTTPPVPLAIQKALDYIAAQKRGSALRIQQ